VAEQIGWRDYERGTDGVKKAEILKIPLEKIFVREGFNPRDLTKVDTRGKILAIKEAYKAGRYVDPIKVTLVGRDVFIVDGQCRYTAATMAHQELVEGGNPGIESLFCIPFRGNDAQALIHTITANEGEKLIPIEVADVVARLLNMGWDRSKVAEALTVTIDWVNKLVFMSTLPERLKQLIKEKKVSTDVAVEVFKKRGEEAVAFLEGEVKDQEKIVTAKKIREVKPMEKDERFLNRVLEQVKVAVVDIGLDKESYPMGLDPEEEYEVVLKGSTLKALVELQETLKKREVKEAEAETE